jgi:hypothetical protein
MKNPYYKGEYPLIPKKQQAEMKRLNCEEEGGVTQVSLRNLDKYAREHGAVRAIEHINYFESDEHTIFHFNDGTKYTATGFSVGYAGEGPRGLVTAIMIYLKRTDITIELVSAWSKDPYVYLMTHGQGFGKQIAIFMGVQDMDFDAEVW